MSRRELAIVLFLVLGSLAPLINIPPVSGALWPQDQTISIDNTQDDKWVTEIGTSIDSWLVHILDPGYDLRSFVIFRGVEINFWEPLYNATLRLHTANTLAPDPDSTVTLYGMKVDELQDILPIGPSSILSMTLTDRYVNINTSAFQGAQWHEVDVTAIVEELVRAHNWDGDGITGTETGDAIGFIMLGARGHDVRYFTDYRSDPALSAQLVIHWNHQPPLNDPPPDVDYIEQHGNYSIWGVPVYDYDDPEYIFWREGGAVPFIYYDKVHPQPSERFYVEQVQDTNALYSGGARQITRMENGTIYVVYYSKKGTAVKKVYVIHSNDEGATWIGDTKLSTLDGMVAKSQSYPRIAVDSNNTLHVIWEGTSVSDTNIWYVNYTTSWSDPIPIITIGDMTSRVQTQPAISIDEWDNLHVTWIGANITYPSPDYQVWYSNRTATSTWCNPVRISTLAGMDGERFHSYPTITCDSSNVIHIAFQGSSAGFPNPYNQIWHSYTYTNNSWSDPVRVSTYAGMNVLVQRVPSIAVGYANDNAHLTWWGEATGIGNTQIWYSSFSDTWTTPIPIANAPGMPGEHQKEATIAVYPDETITVLWTGQATIQPTYFCIWERRNINGSWGTVHLLQDEEEHDLMTPNLAYSRFPETFNMSYTYFNADPNGTVVQGPFNTLKEAQDCIDTKDTDPQDPEPPVWEGSPTAFSRFRMRLYFLLLGYFSVFGPIWFMCWKRPSGFYVCVAFIIMLTGVGLLLQIPYV